MEKIMRKVNINTLITNGNLKVKGQSQFKIKEFSPDLRWYNTDKEIEFIGSLIDLTIIRKLRKDESYDLGEDRRFLYLSKIEQIKLVIRLLSRGNSIVVDGHTELSTEENINQLKQLLIKKQNDLVIYDEIRKPIRNRIAEIGYI